MPSIDVHQCASNSIDVHPSLAMCIDVDAIHIILSLDQQKLTQTKTNFA